VRRCSCWCWGLQWRREFRWRRWRWWWRRDDTIKWHHIILDLVYICS
jgi:hypothetical protein